MWLQLSHAWANRCKVGEIPGQWMTWVEQNLDRGVNPNVLLDVLKHKGFHPVSVPSLVSCTASHSLPYTHMHAVWSTPAQEHGVDANLGGSHKH